MTLRKDVYELLCLYQDEHPRQAFKPDLVKRDHLAALAGVPPPPFPPKGCLLFRSQVPDHLEPAYDIALGEELLEQDVLKPNEQLEWYQSTGIYDIPQDKPWPVFPAWADALVHITNKGRGAIASRQTIRTSPPGKKKSQRRRPPTPSREMYQWVDRQRSKKVPVPWDEVYDELTRGLAARKEWNVPRRQRSLEEGYRRYLKTQRTARA